MHNNYLCDFLPQSNSTHIIDTNNKCKIQSAEENYILMWIYNILIKSTIFLIKYSLFKFEVIIRLRLLVTTSK